MDKYFALIVLLLGAPLAIGATIAMFFNPAHIFTAFVLWSMVRASLYEPDNDGENLITALRRVFAHGVGGNNGRTYAEIARNRKTNNTTNTEEQ